MSERYKIIEQNDIHFVTLTIISWVDIFTRKDYCEIIIENLKYCQNHKGLIVYGYVIMSNHIHLIVQSTNTKGLSATLRDFKSYSAKKILELVHLPGESRKDWMIHVFKYYAKVHTIAQDHIIWKHGNHPIHLWSEKVIRQKLNYIHQNPVEAGLINTAEAWVYSSMSNYLGLPSVLDITLLDAAYRA